MTQRSHHVAVRAALALLLILLPRGADAWASPARISAATSLTSVQRTASRLSALFASYGVDDRGDAPTRIPSRRTFLARAATSVLLPSAAVLSGANPAAATDDDLIDVYFGCGCFWHVQHEFVEAERRILGRGDGDITSRAGYAGGRAGASNGKVCYHNAQNLADYGKLGHAEVVSMRIPSEKFEDFAVEYCNLFDKDGFRPDQFGDRGTEYRNLVGIPGGKSSPLAEKLVKASLKAGDKLDFAVGKGDDKDLAKVAFIMDTAEFPSFVAEQYHQFHDGFNFGENYPNTYNSLAGKFSKGGEDFGGCPNGMMGIGVGGL